MNPPPIHRDNGSTCRAYDLAMRPRVAMLLAFLLLAACSGGSSGLAEPSLDAGTTPSSTPPPATQPPAPDTTPDPSTQPTATEPPTTPVATDSPTTTIDEAAVLADAEAAYMNAFEVRLEVLRNPSDPAADAKLAAAYTETNLEVAREDLRRTIDGAFVVRENPDNPSFAEIEEPAEVVEGATDTIEIVVCEFNSDRVLQVRADGTEELLRDDPVTLLNVARMKLEDGVWKLASGQQFEEVKDERERCSDVS